MTHHSPNMAPNANHPWLRQAAGYAGVLALSVLLIGATAGCGASSATSLESYAQNYMDSNVVLVQPEQCSGALVRDNKGITVGAVTAAHCEQAGKPTQTVQTGNDLRHLSKSYQVASRILLYNTDQAFFVFQGHTPQEVVKDYNATRLSESEYPALKPGETSIWMGGWPVAPDTKTATERKELELTYLATSHDAAGNAEYPTILAVSYDPANESCTPGTSGSEGFVVVDSTIRPVGLLIKNYDLSIPGQRDTFRHSLYPKVGHIDWNKATYVCEFSTAALNTDTAYDGTTPTLGERDMRPVISIPMTDTAHSAAAA